MTALSQDDLVLVTGGHGFIGSHVANRLLKDGHRVRLTDSSARSAYPIPEHEHLEVIIGNLCDLVFCRRVLRDISVVLHFAANMGGMGTIHEANDSIIYSTNQKMTTNILFESISPRFSVKAFLFASSACVYPESLQCDSDQDVSLVEYSVWANPPPKPQGLYGLEKLVSEILLEQYKSRLDIRIARFHNIYGPGGTWCDGREKAPAAFLRKAIASKLRGIGHDRPTIEIWGNGKQRRSFLYIDDCVDALMLLMRSSFTGAVNIGSDASISITELAKLAARAAFGIPYLDIAPLYSESKPVGVASRNSNNILAETTLHWSPRVGLEAGMAKTSAWIEEQMLKEVEGLAGAERQSILASFETSIVKNLSADALTFALLLPITSRGSDAPGDCLKNLETFALSLLRTTWRESYDFGNSTQFQYRIYLVIDHDDSFLLNAGNDMNQAQSILARMGITDVVSIVCSYPRGEVCSLWRDAARCAWENGCDYFVLFGDDVVLQDAH